MKSCELLSNWKFWYKLILGVAPLLSISLFITGQYLDFKNGLILPTLSKEKLNEKFDSNLLILLTNYVSNHENGKLFLYVFFRNILLITTIVNIFVSLFLINSAINQKNEGNGKLDNANIAYVIMFLSIFVVIFYNLSRIFDYSSNSLKWYTIISWIIEHSVVSILFMIYFILFYNKQDFEVDNTKKWINKSLWFGFVMFYMFISVIIGIILNSSGAKFHIYGTMSPSGYFPYSFLDVVSGQKSLSITLNFNGAVWVQLFMILIFISLILVLVDYLFHFILSKTL
ncbi:hypothetical protein [Spiroplasma endosymbiont of Aspidapion aeneum]|uniref:hypothetical protein n=1 Tax=Spiroplasma endosymbiont of Aspidapion aeneum TaxID=3066276 RepID=UPI00313EF605